MECLNGNKNKWKQTMWLLRSGSTLHTTAQHTCCLLRLNPTVKIILHKHNEISLIKIKEINSLDINDGEKLQEHHNIHFVFDLATKSMMLNLCSMCGCYDGCHKFSHLSGLMLL